MKWVMIFGTNYCESNRMERRKKTNFLEKKKQTINHECKLQEQKRVQTINSDKECEERIKKKYNK